MREALADLFFLFCRTWARWRRERSPLRYGLASLPALDAARMIRAGRGSFTSWRGTLYISPGASWTPQAGACPHEGRYLVTVIFTEVFGDLVPQSGSVGERDLPAADFHWIGQAMLARTREDEKSLAERYAQATELEHEEARAELREALARTVA